MHIFLVEFFANNANKKGAKFCKLIDKILTLIPEDLALVPGAGSYDKRDLRSKLRKKFSSMIRFPWHSTKI